MTRRYALIVVLVIVVIAQAVLLLRARREVTERGQEAARLKDQRSMFCVFYHGAVQTNRLAMADAPSDNRAFGHLFYQLSMSPYLDLCHVDEQTRAKMAARNWDCESVVGGYDYPCLARVARELEDAIPSTP